MARVTEKYDIFFQTDLMGRIGFDGKSITILSTPDGKNDLIRSFLADLKRDTGQTDAEFWKSLPNRVNGRMYVRTVNESEN